jgi:aminoglycoside phosphotransferase (APT) family kinase protein
MAIEVSTSSEARHALSASLIRMGLIEREEQPTYTRLAGGVSSDIWQVTTRQTTFCIKRALSRLRVKAEWFAPIERGRFEVAWFRVAGNIVPNAVPKVLGVDPEAGFFAMEYLDPSSYANWKEQLRDGQVNVNTAQSVGQLLGSIHASTAGRRDVSESFQTGEIFDSIRLEPYLRATARKHPDLEARLHALADLTASPQCALALVHGDISPKNILVGPQGPVFLDAECAWYGDPAFDVAFCLNHLLLKCLWRPRKGAVLLTSFSTLWNAYERTVDWEETSAMEARVAALLPALFLARVDGKSPVEYITTDADKDRVRRVARRLIAEPPRYVDEIRTAWTKELGLG